MCESVGGSQQSGTVNPAAAASDDESSFALAMARRRQDYEETLRTQSLQQDSVSVDGAAVAG